MIARLLGLLAALVATLALGRATGDGLLAATLASVIAVLALAGPRWELDRGRQLVTSAMGAGAGYAMVTLFYEPHAGSLSEGWTRLGAAAVLAAAARFVVARPAGGTVVTSSLLFVSLLAAGETHTRGYTTFVVLFLVASLGSTAAGQQTSRGIETTARRVTAGTAIVLLGSVIAAGAAFGLRTAYTWITNRARSSALVWEPRVGFSDQMDLGALDGLLDSDTVVLRVRGPRVDYLRGAALDVYAAGRWARSDSEEVETLASFNGDAPADERVEIAAVSESTNRFFLPLDARLIATIPAQALVDGAGAIKRLTKRGLNLARFARGERDRATPAAPATPDLQMPRRIRPQLETLASEWTLGETGVEGKLGAIERHLRTGFRYARTFARTSETDPAIEFLFQRRTGHCEYFATAMVLVARAAGIPARVAVGYRVGEESPFGYYVVRERNAHAWVEAWIPGRGWTTRDPTPGAELPQNREHRAGYVASVADALRAGYDDLTDWFRQRSLVQTAVAWGIGIALLAWIVARGARRRRVDGPRAPEDELPLPCLVALLSTLEGSGHEVHDYEPLEQLAARARDANADAARLLERYAALRYGSIGDERALADDVLSYARALETSRAADHSALK